MQHRVVLARPGREMRTGIRGSAQHCLTWLQALAARPDGLASTAGTQVHILRPDSTVLHGVRFELRAEQQ
ncbi:hypothetical protein ACWZHB_01180 [Nocardia sp. FBN12]|uniref:hypothetical protein n=1 Tax=Nocardia sp. FBN12 TaxID=3419766 RepID=UPI003D01C31F